MEEMLMYRARDGKIFTTKNACKIYDDKILEKQFLDIPKVELTIPLVDYNMDNTVYLMQLRNKQDFEAMKEYFTEINGTYGENYINEYEEIKTFPCYQIIYDCENYTDYAYCPIDKDTNHVDIMITGLKNSIKAIENFIEETKGKRKG